MLLIWHSLCYIARSDSFYSGVIGIGIIYLGLKLILPSEGQSLYQLSRFFRYLLLGIWISFGAPRLFIRMGLARQVEKKS
jgi:hypothetical protein